MPNWVCFVSGSFIGLLILSVLLMMFINTFQEQLWGFFGGYNYHVHALWNLGIQGTRFTIIYGQFIPQSYTLELAFLIPLATALNTVMVAGKSGSHLCVSFTAIAFRTPHTVYILKGYLIAICVLIILGKWEINTLQSQSKEETERKHCTVIH